MTARAQTTCGETGCRSRRLAASPPMRQGAGPAGLGSHRYPATRGIPTATQSGALHPPLLRSTGGVLLLHTS